MSRRLCAAAALVSAGVLSGSAASSSGLDGNYRATISAADLRAVGTPADIALVDAGSWRLVVADGHWTLRQSRGPFGNAVDRGDVVVAGPVAKFTLRTSDGHPHHVYDGALRWRRSGTGLRFAIIGHEREDVAGVLAARPWVSAV
jgi:hypothetical protein